ncbi:uncharacterized protein LOC124352952 [Homalodisca vitripennis]|uniref:uncharacterized protein LOC124352952 n=1 Tax=Homalodisca vitripennis TaxID=197043 RepID=UPI001EEB147F|nr:uncharacterized protein LOC124352952 [Homalodisca vitripennis]XP_046658653.1 uncharacterized protein LOC124352952 [Homalodisca vitripennis]
MDNPWHLQFENKYRKIEPQDIEDHISSDYKITFVAQRWGDWVALEIDGLDEKQDLREFRVMRESTREAYTSFAFRKHFPFYELFMRTTQRFIDHGLWAYWGRKLTSKNFSRKELLVEKDVKVFNQPEQLTLTKLHPVFVLHIIGLSLSFLVFLIEYYYCYS